MNTRDFYDHIFLISYGFLFTTSFLGFSNESSIFYREYQILKDIILPLSWMVLFFQPNLFRKRDVFLQCVLFILFIYFSYMAKDSSFLLAYIFIITSKFIDIKKIINMLYFIAMFSIIIIVISFLYKYYILDDAEYIYDMANERFRYTFEMFHPNIFPMRCFIFLSLFFIVKNKLSIMSLLSFLLFIFFVYSFTYSRTSFYLSVLLLIIMYISQFWMLSKQKLFQWIMKISVLLFPVLSIWAMLNYDNSETLFTINTLLSERIRLSYEAYSLLGFSFIPKNIRPILDVNNITIDNLYVLLSLSNFSLLIMFSFISYILMNFLLKNFLYKEAIIFFFMIVYSITESHMVNIGYNYILLFLSLMYRGCYNKDNSKYRG